MGYLLVLATVAFSASVFFRAHPGQFDPWLDAGLYNVPFALAAFACWQRAARDATDRWAWLVLAIGFAIFTAGNVYGSLVVGDKPIYPSPADAMWLTYYLFLYVAIVLLVKTRVARFHASTWLDGAVAGLGAAAVVVTFALGPVLADTKGTLSVVATNLAYPTAEILLIVFLVAAGSAIRTRERSWWLLVVGIAVFCVGDVLYLYEESAGIYSEGGLLDISWPVGVMLMGLAACGIRAHAPAARVLKQRFIVPVLFTTSSVGLLVLGQSSSLPPVAIGLAVAALGAAAGRTALTVREVKALAESRIEARTDELTGLPNRRRLFEELRNSIDGAGAPMSLLILDLDRFKEVNDSLGHSAGDELLQAIGNRWSALVPSTALLTRLGGDEFAVLLPRPDTTEALLIAEKLREAMKESFPLVGVEVTIDVSIGIASAPGDGQSAEIVTACADVAMYRAKRDRSGVAAFSRDLDTPSRGDIQLLAELRAALEDEQLELHYQPQLNLKTGTISGVEALVRWQHPTRGLVSPEQFLPLAERWDLMSALTAFVLHRAMRDAAELRGAGFDLRMSINISSRDLIDERLPEKIAAELRANGLAPEMLAIEVTENAIMIDRVRSIAVLMRLRDAGVRISVDDYGTGQASLSYLRDLPVGELKLDRSFLEGVPTDAHNAAIVRSTVELAHALNLPIVAEGVENSATLDWLRLLGCDLLQGFHIARPFPLEKLRAWMESNPFVVRASSRGGAESRTVGPSRSLSRPRADVDAHAPSSPAPH